MLDRYEGDGSDVVQPGGVWEIDNGWAVFAADGEKVGDVDEVQPHYIVVGKGFIFHSERYVPVTAITNVQNEQVFLNVSSHEIDSQGWDRIPDPAGDAEVAGTADDVGDGNMRDPADAQASDARPPAPVDLPLREDEIRVRRYPVSHGYGTGEIPPNAFQELEIEIPIRGEQVDVSARPVVREEVEVSRVVRERNRDAAGA